MAEPFLAETRMFSFSFPPKGWALCNGQLLPINQNQALFSLMSTTYGGDGRVNFGLPDLRGRMAIHAGNGHVLGERGGEHSHTLTLAEAAHVDLLNASSAAAHSQDPTGRCLAVAQANAYVENLPGHAIPSGAAVAMHAASLSGSTQVGGNQAHLNMSPFLVLNQCIALQGIFPSQS
jgi:microcystin-dependent protein